MRCLFIHLLHLTSLIFPHNHLLCWGTCLGGKSISQNSVDRRQDPDHAAMFAPHAWHHHVIWIAWHEDVFHAGEEMKVRRCQIQAVGRVLKNFPDPLFQKFHCHISCMQSGIVMQQQPPLVWHPHLRPLALNSSLKFLRVAWWEAELTVSLGGEKCNRSTPCMSQNTVAISFPQLVDVLNFLTVGDPGCFHATDCTFVSRQYWCTQVSSPVMICSMKSSPWSLKWRRWVRDAPIQFFLWSSVSCQWTQLLHTFLYPKCSWTMSQIVPRERLNCSSNSLSNTRRSAHTVSSIVGTRSADVEGGPLLCSCVTRDSH